MKNIRPRIFHCFFKGENFRTLGFELGFGIRFELGFGLNLG